MAEINNSIQTSVGFTKATLLRFADGNILEFVMVFAKSFEKR